MSFDPSFRIAPYCTGIEANRTVRDRILTRLQSQSRGRNVTATDLVSVRQAYWARVHPEVKVDMERSADMLAGSGFHDAFNWKVSSEEWVEQSVSYQDIHGRIDIFEDRPLELKTSKVIIEPDEIKTLRPSYLEQLGLYCAMVERPDGHILIYNRGQGRSLIGASVHFDNLKGIQKEMIRRRDLLYEAIDNKDPSTLPACQWKGKGCIYEGICDCGAETATFPIADLAQVQADQTLEKEFALRFKNAPTTQPIGIRINDLVFPRKAFFKSASEVEESDLSEDLAALASMGAKREFKYRALGVSGELTSRPVQFGDVTGRVEFHEGRTLWVAWSNFAKPVERYRLASALEHGMLRLGFNAALANKGKSRLVVYYPNVPDDASKVMVYDFTWKNLNPIRDEAGRRAGLLVEAKSSGRFSILPKCPQWMCKYCEHSATCLS